MVGDVAEAPERVGRYEILLPIAKGGMATVYLARAEGHGGFDRYVALKLTLPHLRRDPEFAAHLLDEAKLVAHIRHTNVVPVLDVGQDELGVFLVMEYVPGESLAGMYRESAKKDVLLPARIGLRALIDALEGLHAAHEHGDEEGHPLHVVHRDFSPQNILLSTDGVARLTDFGIAKAASRASSTLEGQVKGKMSYVSPEQAQGAPLDRRCDLWAAGIIAWEIMCGRKLHPPNDKASLLTTMKREPPLIRTVNPDAPKALEEVIANVLKLDPNHRPATASLLARDLTTAARKAGVLAETHEVSEYVKVLAGPILAERKTRLAAARRRRMESFPDTMATAIGVPSPLESASKLAMAMVAAQENAQARAQQQAQESAQESAQTGEAAADDGSIVVTADSEAPPKPQVQAPLKPKPKPKPRFEKMHERTDESAMSLEVPRSAGVPEIGSLGLLPAPSVPDPESDPRMLSPLFGEPPPPEKPRRAEGGAADAVQGLIARLPKDRRTLMMGAAGMGVLGFVLILIVVLKLASGRDASADAEAGAGAGEADADNRVAASTTSTTATSTTTTTTTPNTGTNAASAAGAAFGTAGEVSGVQFLALKANAPVTEVRIGDRAVDMVIPAPNVNVELMPEETVHALKITAKSTDGRVANVDLARGELEGTLAFGSAPPPMAVQPQLPRPPAPKTTTTPPKITAAPARTPRR